MPNEGGQRAAVDPWQAANHFFVFLQALVLLGQLWGWDREGLERVREGRVEGFLEKQTQDGCVSAPFPPCLELSPWVIFQWRSIGEGGRPIPQGRLRDSGGVGGVPGWVLVVGEEFLGILGAPTGSLPPARQQPSRGHRVIKLSKEAFERVSDILYKVLPWSELH